MLKREADQDLVGAVRAVGRGEAFLTNAAERSIIRDWMSGSAAGPAIPLTPREEEVVKLIAEAHTNSQIAQVLHLAEKTVESHRANVLRKLGCATASSWCATRSAGGSSRPEGVAWAERQRPNRRRRTAAFGHGLPGVHNTKARQVGRSVSC